MNYQYRFGTSFTEATKTLYEVGGYGRYYDGLGAALFQGEHSSPSHHVISSSLPRSPFEIRRHGSECWHSRFASIKLLFERHAFTSQNSIRISVVSLASSSHVSLRLT